MVLMNIYICTETIFLSVEFCLSKWFEQWQDLVKMIVVRVLSIENRIYREELKESLGMNFFSPFQLEKEFKVYRSCKCSQII